MGPKMSFPNQIASVLSVTRFFNNLNILIKSISYVNINQAHNLKAVGS